MLTGCTNELRADCPPNRRKRSATAEVSSIFRESLTANMWWDSTSARSHSVQTSRTAGHQTPKRISSASRTPGSPMTVRSPSAPTVAKWDMVRKPASRNAIPSNVWRSNVSTVEMLAIVLETVLKSAVIGLLAATAVPPSTKHLNALSRVLRKGLSARNATKSVILRRIVHKVVELEPAVTADLRTTWRATATNLAMSPLSPAVTVIKLVTTAATAPRKRIGTK
ncbi:hypothetical protein C8Q69DRAFT_63753 [Paecilomyces variotii]|uniref:Uncharacterized protein n=1 Tax=Byssochlamys spectabilis TaxID=264951 RepID=A0A443HN74_BYSSP|nr:hypothetical protein C8Q69DRAFT_63753 [Paecilomyces variotii]RWQ93230.1 hypothetical protein C8Q69DRAFT_63753 [Paecilomyces variotii]